MGTIDDKIIRELSDYIREKIGIYFPSKKYDELRFKLKEIAKENGYQKTSDFVNYIINETDNKKQVELLASKLTIGETYFWRDRALFRALEETIIPNIIEKKRNSRKTLRIWSAGSASGEEAYSIAILLKRLISDINQWNITILATDINQASLNKAQKGNYTEWSFRSAPHWLKEDYFTKKKSNNYVLNEDVKRMVTFSYLNLIQDHYPSLSNNTNGMDIIFCRNVLMYFCLDDIKTVSGNLYNCLINNGLFFTTPSESFQYISPRFKYSHINDVFVYQRKPEAESTKKELKKKLESDNQDFITIPKRSPKRIANKAKPLKAKPIKVNNKAYSDFDFSDAKEFYDSGFYLKAENILEEIIKDCPNQEAVLLMARIKANFGKLDEALSYCVTSLEINKLSPESYYLNAMIKAEKGNIEEAYTSLKKSFYLNSSFVITNYTLATFANILNKKEESNKYYNNTINLLENMNTDEIIPASDGITAGRLKEIINTTSVN